MHPKFIRSFINPNDPSVDRLYENEPSFRFCSSTKNKTKKIVFASTGPLVQMRVPNGYCRGKTIGKYDVKTHVSYRI